MSKELIVSSGRHETRVAILEDDQVVELFHEREKEYSLAGSIHKGRVTRVLPGMQSAFVDIGLDRDAFLYVSDFFEDNDEYDAVVSTVEEKVLKMERGGGGSAPDRGRPTVVEAIERNVHPSVHSPAEDGVSVASVAEGVGGAVPAVPATTDARSTEPKQEGNRDGRGDRGGRGRRGRRRRGGRGSGLPDSKFFSPKAESASAAGDAEEPESETEVQVPAARSFSAVPSDDFMVLPGESLAKYAPDDARENEVSSYAHEAPEPEAAPAHLPEPEPAKSEPVNAETKVEIQIEAAVPVEHPLAGFGEVAAWVGTPVVEQPPVAAEALDIEPTAAESTPAEPEMAAGAAVVEIENAEIGNDDEGLSAAEVAEAELAADVRAAETFDDEPANPETSVEASTMETGLDEGPEPARIPTSLTATLREQGHRYPHRVSRRMRRKMRGGQQGEEGHKPVSDGPADGRVDDRNVTPRREERGPAENREPAREQAREQTREPREAKEREALEPSKEPRQQESRGSRERPERDRPAMPSISDLLKEGQEIIVQIAKEPLGQKGARITSHIALPGRFVVYMPTVEHVGVSRKIPSDEERQRLKRVLQTHRQGVPGGFICRTAAENKSEEELKSDMHFLYNLWLDMRQKAEKKPAPVLLHHDLDLVQRILRDQLTTSFKTIWVDNEELYESILSFVQRFQPALVGRVKLYTRSNPIFDEFGITAEVEKALRPKVWLKSGGYIVINQTEALVAIDINTGKYVGKSNRLEDTIVKINTDAIKEIVRQIRLRDLGGIIVVDFIDMDERKNRQKVMLALEDSMRADRAPYKILQFNDFGLVAITRKRVKQSLERTLCSPCGYCEGAGYIKSVGTVVSEILQEAQKMHKTLEAEQSNLVLRVNPEVAKVLKSNHNSYLQEIEEILGKSVLVKSDPQLHQTKFDLA
jgi:ribonuclease G